MALIGHDSTDIHSIYVNVGEEALRRHRREGTPLSASGTKVDIAAARWWPDS